MTELQGDWDTNNAQGPVPVPLSPSSVLPDRAAFLRPHSTRADMILPGRSGRKIPHQPPHHCPLVFQEGLLQPKATSAAPAAGQGHCAAGGVWNGQGPPSPYPACSAVGAAPQCVVRVVLDDTRNLPELGKLQPKTAWPCQQGSPGSQESLAMLESEQSTSRTTKQNVLKGLGGRGSQTLPCGSQGSPLPIYTGTDPAPGAVLHSTGYLQLKHFWGLGDVGWAQPLSTASCFEVNIQSFTGAPKNTDPAKAVHINLVLHAPGDRWGNCGTDTHHPPTASINPVPPQVGHGGHCKLVQSQALHTMLGRGGMVRARLDWG